MKIALFSSDPAIEKFYKSLKKAGFEIVLLVSESAKKQGRKLEIIDNPAVEFAKNNKIKFITPDEFDSNAIAEITNSGANIGFIFAYGKILKENIIHLFPFGILNVHPSLLPEFRGPSPLQQTFIENKKISGYSIIKINNEMDAGDILFQNEVKVSESDDFNSLREKVLEDASSELPEIIKGYLSGQINPIKQDSGLASYTKLIKKSDALIDEKDNAKSALNKIKAYAKWPKAYLIIDNKRLIIHEAKLTGERLFIERIQPEGKSIMLFRDFINGYRSILTKFPSFVKVD